MRSPWPLPRPRALSFKLLVVVGVWVLALLAGCGSELPLVPANRRPQVQSLIAFPASFAHGDSAVIVCNATDPDGDELWYDWTSDCRLVKKGASSSGSAYTRSNTLVVYAGACAVAPLDTGWVSCTVSDQRGGGRFAGIVKIVILP